LKEKKKKEREREREDKRRERESLDILLFPIVSVNWYLKNILSVTKDRATHSKEWRRV